MIETGVKIANYSIFRCLLRNRYSGFESRQTHQRITAIRFAVFLIRLKRDENPESIGLPRIRKYFWEKVGVPHRLYNLWGDKQTSERGGFASSKSPRTKIAMPSPGRRTKFM